MISPSLKKTIEKQLSKEGKEINIKSFVPKSGGSINEAFEIRTNQESYFLKINDAKRYPGMFECEKKGLIVLADCARIDVPIPCFTGEDHGISFIVMTCIEKGEPAKSFWADFGLSLSQIHRKSADQFGFLQDNYIGSLPQRNSWHAAWSDFFILERLEPLARKSKDLGELDAEGIRRFDRLFAKLTDLFPEESPSLLHGDLWSGNYMCNGKGKAVIFDPAIYYGHREMDLAMSKLFGGFAPEFYRAYQDSFPLEPGWEERLDLCNLYPLLVHVILFGGGYAQSVMQILRRYT